MSDGLETPLGKSMEGISGGEFLSVKSCCWVNVGESPRTGAEGGGIIKPYEDR